MATILVVDDDAAMRSMIARALTGDGHAVTEAGDGEAALEVLGKSAFALLVTDVQMPGMDGLTLAERAGGMAPGARSRRGPQGQTPRPNALGRQTLHPRPDPRRSPLGAGLIRRGPERSGTHRAIE
jgi:hypothetical protein